MTIPHYLAVLSGKLDGTSEFEKRDRATISSKLMWDRGDVSHAIENTANQKARNPLHVLRYATGSFPRKNLGVPRGLQIFPEYFLPFVERLFEFNEHE